MSQNIDLDSWADSLRAWPNRPECWVTWYNRVAKTYQPTWETMGIADALSLSLSPLEKNENLLKTIGYFWSWTDDSNPPRRSDDHWFGHLIIWPLCLQTIRSPLQVVLQNRVHKLGCIPEPAP
jgi:hypothetical protein